MVPSLYVRVYRIFIKNGKSKRSSLIIREGISSPFFTITPPVLFPHYT